MSENEILELSKQKSLYPPIEIRIEGKLYQSRKFTRAMLLSLDPLEKKLDKKDSDWNSLVAWMLIVFGVPEPELEELEVSEIEDIYMKVKVDLLRRQKNRMNKSLNAIKTEVDEVKDAAKVATGIVSSVEDLEKNVKRSGETNSS